MILILIWAYTYAVNVIILSNLEKISAVLIIY